MSFCSDDFLLTQTTYTYNQQGRTYRVKKERRQAMEENSKSLYELYMEVEAMQQELIHQFEKENKEKEISVQQPKKVKLVGDKKLKEIDELLSQLRTQRKSLKVLNSSQAVSIAQNVYLKGELKKFRTDERNLEKIKSLVEEF